MKLTIIPTMILFLSSPCLVIGNPHHNPRNTKNPHYSFADRSLTPPSPCQIIDPKTTCPTDKNIAALLRTAAKDKSTLLVGVNFLANNPELNMGYVKRLILFRNERIEEEQQELDNNYLEFQKKLTANSEDLVYLKFILDRTRNLRSRTRFHHFLGRMAIVCVSAPIILSGVHAALSAAILRLDAQFSNFCPANVTEEWQSWLE